MPGVDGVTEDGVPATEEERHASWAELFFDLVVVAGTPSSVTPSTPGTVVLRSAH